MATYHGKDAKVDKGGTAIANIVSWTIDSTFDIVEISDFGDADKIFDAGMNEWGGSFEGHLDPENTEQAAVQTAHLTPAKITDCKFYIDGTHYFSGDIWLTGYSPSTSISDVAKGTWTFKGDGALAYN